jgi:hypothetical protein
VLKTSAEGLSLGLSCLLNTSASIFCESIAFFVFKAFEWGVAFSKLPRVLHHHREVVVAVDGTANSFIVLVELVESHDTVGVLRVPLGHELREDLVGAFLARLNIGVLTRVVDLGDVLEGHLAVLVYVKLVVGSSDPVLTAFVELSLQTHIRVQ